MPPLDTQPPIRPAATNLGEQFTRDLRAFGNAFSSDSSSLLDKIGGIFSGDSSGARLSAAGLPPGGDPQNQVPSTITNPVISKEFDPRVRLSLPIANTLLYNDQSAGILQPLASTNGIIFPYLPTINMTYQAAYGQMQPAHTNQPFPMYQNSQVGEITISGEFTAQNEIEARYMMACIHFLRVVTKMFYGQDQLKGTPPVVLRLNGHGQYMFDNIPVVVTTAIWALPTDVDYIPVPMNSIASQANNPGALRDYSGVTNVPTDLTISITLMPMYSRKRYVEDFSLTEYAKGNLLSRGGRGGFL